MMSTLKRIGWAVLLVTAAAAAGFADEPRFRASTVDDAWRQLPRAVAGHGEPLPAWATILAPSLPTTTAAMLEMDRVQRTESALDPKLRAKIRWVAARANECSYAEAYARADLLSSGGGDADLEAIVSHPKDLPPAEQRAYDFARLMCRAAYEVTDDQVQQLVEDYGPEDLTAIVLLLAYANFQDRLFNALDVEVEASGPLPPPTAQFDWKAVQHQPAPVPPIERKIPEKPARDTPVATKVDDPAWSLMPPASLRAQLEQQQQREPRIPIPPAEVVERNMPPGMYPPGQSTAIRWNSVTFGYQPKLSAAWIFTLRRFRYDAALPDDFRQSLFWVVTRSNQCYY